MIKARRIVLMCILFLYYVHLQAQNIIIKKCGLSFRVRNEHATVIKDAEGNVHQGDIVIPEYIEYQGVRYIVTQIEAEAFSDCISVTSVRIPVTVKYIKSLAFKGCEQLTAVEIPEDISFIDATAFYGCTALPQTDGLRYAGRFLVDVADTSQKEYIVKPGTRWIGANALSNLNSVETITLPHTVEVIGCFAFSCCPNLKRIQFPEHLSRIEHYAFSSCTNLSELKHLSSVEEAGQFLFHNCKKATKLEKLIDNLSEKRIPFN